MFMLAGNRGISGYFVVAGLLSMLFYMLWRIWKCMKLYREFPSTFSMMFSVVYSIAMNKIPKDLPFSSFLFQKLILLAHRFHKEGLYLLWCPEPLLFVFGADTVKAIVNEKEVLEKPNKYYAISKFLGKGLVTSDVDIWRKHRKLLNPVFHVGMFRNKMSIFNDNADNLVKKLEKEAMNERPIDVFDIIKTCAISVLFEYIFGLKRNVPENKEIMTGYVTKLRAGIEMLVSTIGRPWLHLKFLRKFFSTGRKYEKAFDNLHNVSTQVLLAMKEKIILQRANRAIGSDGFKDDDESRKSFAHILLDHHLKDNSFTMEDIKYQVSNFIPAGFDTVSHALLWSLFLLGHDPDVQNRAYDEVNALLEKRIKYEDLRNLEYLDGVIKESLRLFPPVPAYGRKLNKDVKCGKYIVPKGTDVFIFTHMLHRNPKVYPDPEKFDPERFLEGGTSRRHENYFPFGHGIRDCIGKGFAIIEMKVILAYILRNFKVTSLERKEIGDIAVLGVVRPPKFLFTPRK